MESNMESNRRPKPPPRSSSIRANLCKFLTKTSSKTSYVVNHTQETCQDRTLPISHLSTSSLSTSSSSPHDNVVVGGTHPLQRLSEGPVTSGSSGFRPINFFRSKNKQSSHSVDMDFNEMPGMASKKKLWIKSFTSLDVPLSDTSSSSNTRNHVTNNEKAIQPNGSNNENIPSQNISLSPSGESNAILSQVVPIKTSNCSAISGVKMRIKKTTEQQQQQGNKKNRPKSEATFLEEFYSRKKIESNVEKQRKPNHHHHRHSTIEGNLRFGSLESYVRLDQLGEGSYATVFRGYSYLMSKVVALKEIRLETEEGTPFTAIREASILRCLRHANIVTLHDIIHTKETLTFVFEYVVSIQNPLLVIWKLIWQLIPLFVWKLILLSYYSIQT